MAAFPAVDGRHKVHIRGDLGRFQRATATVASGRIGKQPFRERPVTSLERREDGARERSFLLGL
jgi:hypothetical protein